MCRKCLKVAKSLFPKASDRELHDLLWSATAFPMGGPDFVYRQLKEGIENSDGSVEGVITYAAQEFDREFDDFKKAQEEAAA